MDKSKVKSFIDYALRNTGIIIDQEDVSHILLAENDSLFIHHLKDSSSLMAYITFAQNKTDIDECQLFRDNGQNITLQEDNSLVA